METPENLAGKLTEKIMLELKPILTDYNKAYEKVYSAVKPHTDANEKCLHELNNYDTDGVFYGAGFSISLELLNKCK